MNNSELERQLEALGQTRYPAPPGLAARIIANAGAAPREPMAMVLYWLRTSPWRGALAAACPLLLGFLIGIAVELNSDSYGDSMPGGYALTDTYEEYTANEI